jgi:hypothetical protein
MPAVFHDRINTHYSCLEVGAHYLQPNLGLRADNVGNMCTEISILIRVLLSSVPWQIISTIHAMLGSSMNLKLTGLRGNVYQAAISP